MPPDTCADRSAQDVVAATLTSRGITPADARHIAALVVSDLIGAGWFVVAASNLRVIAEYCGGDA